MTQIQRLAAAGLAGLSLLCAAAHAEPISLHLTMTVTGIHSVDGEELPVDRLYTPPAIGDRHYARLVVDDDFHHLSGSLYAARVERFRAQIGQTIWDSVFAFERIVTDPTQPLWLSTVDYRGPCRNSLGYVCNAAEDSLYGADSAFIGLEIVDGVIRSVQGGIYGSGDFPFIDWFLPPPGSFFTQAAYAMRDADDPSLVHFLAIGLDGTTSIARIPEPAPFALFGTVLAGLAWRRARRR